MRLLALIILLFITAQGTAIAQSASPTRTFKLAPGTLPRDYIPGLLIVKYKLSVQISINKVAAVDTTVESQISLKSAKIESINKKFSAPTTSAIDTIGLDRIYEFRFSGNNNIETVINELLQNPQIEYAEPSYIYRTNYIPNDPSYLSQAYLAQVKAPEAWDLIRSSSNIIIAIVDSGSDLDHPDLAANIFVNTLDPVDGIDNEGDGYIDNDRGWDFVGRSRQNGVQDRDPSVTSDSTSHGVHVSGLASAVSNNGTGVASIASNAKLLIIKTAADNNATAIYAGFEGIKYAADHGAKIINCSWGGYNTSTFALDIINYAISKDCLIIAAAGNDNTSSSLYPSAYPGVISVGSVDATDRKSGFSNYGSRISISAPGNSIYSTLFDNTYGFFSGTSMATPLVSSAAALVKAYYPSYTMKQVGQTLLAAADIIDARNPTLVGQLGSGRLNIYRALTQNFSQSITFPVISDRTFGDSDFDPGATTGSGLPITYFSSNPAVAIIVDGKIKIVGAGTITITATQAGNSRYSAAADVSRVFVINKAAQFITFAKIPVQLRGGPEFKLEASSGSGLAVKFVCSDAFVASVSGDRLLPLRVGRVTISASQEGNANYLPATAIIQNVQVTDIDGSVVKILPAVSPNGDGINDFLTIEGIKDFTNNYVSVFTGNGAQVFQVNNYNNNDQVFKGMNKSGQTLPQGTYFYVVQFDVDGLKQRKAGYFVLKY
jgi:gliding motility-associated-like protein